MIYYAFGHSFSRGVGVETHTHTEKDEIGTLLDVINVGYDQTYYNKHCFGGVWAGAVEKCGPKICGGVGSVSHVRGFDAYYPDHSLL